MLVKSIHGISFFFNESDRSAAAQIVEVVNGVVRLLGEHWGLSVPRNCRVYVMSSWPSFLFHASPWFLLPILVFLFPLIAIRFSRVWRVAGGWNQRYPGRTAVGVKPPRLLVESDRTIGRQIFEKVDDDDLKMQHLACHELTHAFTAHLRLPLWLNEGLAMLAVDHFSGCPTVKTDTLNTLRTPPVKSESGSYRSLRQMNPEVWAYHYARGYWLTRYLDEKAPEVLRGFLEKRVRPEELVGRTAAVFQLNPDDFWSSVDARLVDHFDISDKEVKQD